MLLRLITSGNHRNLVWSIFRFGFAGAEVQHTFFFTEVTERVSSHHHHHDHECGPDCDHEHHHHDDNPHSVKSISLIAGDLDPELFFPWVNQVTQVQGPNILRLKGILAFKDDPQRFVIQGVHMIVEGDHQRDWQPDEKRESRLVFIGRDLNWDVLKQSFEACAAK